MPTSIFVPLLHCAAFRCSRQGALHKEAPTPLPCQDSSCIREGPNYIMAAAADGHGDPRHDRSQRGAELAAKIACDVMLDVFQAYESAGSVLLKRNFRSQFPGLLTKRWREEVLNDYRQQGSFPPDEADEGITEDLHQIYSRYGTTILAIMVVPGAICMAQLGDGDIVLLNEGGGRDIPFPADEALVGGDTFSLSSRDAKTRWQSATRDLGNTKLITLSTDGLRNSYPDHDEDFFKLLESLLTNIRKFGMPEMLKVLPGYLDQYSQGGSGDDITLVGLVFDEESEMGRVTPECCSSSSDSDLDVPSQDSSMLSIENPMENTHDITAESAGESREQ